MTEQDVTDLLIAIERAAWSRSWSRLKQAREQIRVHLRLAHPYGPRRIDLDTEIERCSCSEPDPNDKRMCRACGRRFVRERSDDRIR